MAFSMDRFTALRPYLYHLTHRENLSSINKTGFLRSAAAWMLSSNIMDGMTRKRDAALVISSKNGTVYIRDQQPLHKGNVELQGGWTFEDFVKDLNGRIFFWPGDANRPIEYGVRHFARYKDENPAMIRISSSAIFSENLLNAPEFCAFN